MPKRLTITYYPWITQAISGAELARAMSDFVDLFQTELKNAMGNQIELVLRKEMELPEQLIELKEPPTGDEIGKIGMVNPLGYALLHKEVPAVEAVAVIRRKIGDAPAGPTYNAQLYTHRRTFLKEVKDVRGRSLAFGSPQSTSNFLVPAIMLLRAGIRPLNGLSRVEFTGGHDKAAAAVYEGRLEVGAGHDGVIFDLAGKRGYGDAEQVLQRIDFSKAIPSDPVAVHAPDPSVRCQIRDALCRVAKTDDKESTGNKAVKRFWGTDEGFEPVSPEAYVDLLAMMTELNLRRDDVLRKV